MIYTEPGKVDHPISELTEIIINNIDDSIFLFDSEGKLIFFNKTAEEFVSRIKRDSTELYYTDLFYNSKYLITLIQKGLVEGRKFQCKDIDIVYHGNNINVDVSLYPFYNKSELAGIIVFIKKNFLIIDKDDIHFDSLVDIISSISHEIKNPLSGIKGSAQLLKGLETNSESKQYIELIIKETTRLNSILSDYLSLSQKLVFSDVNIHEALEHALKVMESEIKNKNVIINKSYDPSLPNLKGDASKLLQVFINLIKNAIEAMAESKEIRKLSITTKPATEYIIFHDYSNNQKTPAEPRKQRWIIISFEDTGIGIPPENLNKIFLPFYSMKPGGIGLGLALSKKIVRDHGGTILALPKTSKGALFNVYLPF